MTLFPWLTNFSGVRTPVSDTTRYSAVSDLGGAGYAPPALGQILHFHAVLGKNRSNNRLVPSRQACRVGAPRLEDPGSATTEVLRRRQYSLMKSSVVTLL